MHDRWRRARRELSARDPRLAHLIQLVHPLSYVIPDPRPLNELAVGTVVSQLLSTTAARAVKTRLLEAHGSIEGVMAWARTTPHDAPHAHGLSRSKRRAIAAWADHVAAHGDPSTRWKALPTQELLAEVMALRGFGRWSAEIVAIFGFGHNDVWPEGDAGVQRVMRQLVPGMQPPRRAALVAGHASYAALCCWTVVNRGLEGELTRETEDGGWRVEGGGWRTEGGGRRTGDRGQGTGDRGQGTEDGGRVIRDAEYLNFATRGSRVRGPSHWTR